MRKHLLESFDTSYILDLHGNARKKEVCPDGSADQNVFDIMQGVSINIFVKTGTKKKNELGKVLQFDLYGKRETKYDFLIENNLKDLNWNKLSPNFPNLFFNNKTYDETGKYELGFSIDKLFLLSNSGIATEFDDFVIRHSKQECIKQIEDLKSKNEEVIIREYVLPIKSLQKVKNAIIDLKGSKNITISPISYRPFDNRFCIYTGKTNGLMARPRKDVMNHMIKANYGLCFSRLVVGDIEWRDVFVLNKIVEKGIMAMRVSNNAPLFPLYIYPETNIQQTIVTTAERTPNLNLAIVNEMAEKLGLRFTNEKATPPYGHSSTTPPSGHPSKGEFGEFAPIDILDYIYAVLHSPTYREKYKEFLKIDFPRVPYPKDVDTFWQLVKLGGEIRQIHLLESDVVEQYITQYPEDGDNVVRKPRFSYSPLEGCPQGGVVGNVYINDSQYFANVPEVVWNFYIGGYQPAQKWLKDRKERTLEFDDILHYQKIIVALTETDRIMKEIDGIEIE